MVGDRQSPSELDDFHEYRKRFPYLYICKKCVRSFDSETSVAKCKFCEGDVKEIMKDDKLTAKPMMTYTCAGCYKKFIAEKAEVCPRCGAKYLHAYKTTRVSTRQLISMRSNEIATRLKKTFANVQKSLPQKKAPSTT